MAVMQAVVRHQSAVSQLEGATAWRHLSSSRRKEATASGRLSPVTVDTLWPECSGSSPSAALWERSWQSRGSTAHRADPPASKNYSKPGSVTSLFETLTHKWTNVHMQHISDLLPIGYNSSQLWKGFFWWSNLQKCIIYAAFIGVFVPWKKVPICLTNFVLWNIEIGIQYILPPPPEEPACSGTGTGSKCRFSESLARLLFRNCHYANRTIINWILLE